MRLIHHPNPEFPEVSDLEPDWLRFLFGLAAEIGEAEAAVSLTWLDDAAMRELNRQWRHQDRPTDVLSFHYGAAAPDLAAPEEDPVGEILISVETAARQAAAAGHALAEELSVLVIHGLHHILGLDHEDPEEARRMADAETPFRERIAHFFRAGPERS